MKFHLGDARLYELFTQNEALYWIAALVREFQPLGCTYVESIMSPREPRSTGDHCCCMSRKDGDASCRQSRWRKWGVVESNFPQGLFIVLKYTSDTALLE